MLSSTDPVIYDLCLKEQKRQKEGLELIASENFISGAVMAALSSSFHNKYSEGQVGARYYGGAEYIDAMESLCIERALKLFNLSPEDWGVNVQPYSGSPANFAVYTGLVGPHGRIMGLSLPDGGHLTHGFFAASGKKVSATSLFFESMPYCVDKTTGLIDYDTLATTAKLFRPKLIVAGTSAYSRQLDYARFRQIADSVGAILMADMAHICGLVAAGLHPSPFEYADVVTTTTHKTLRAARGAMIFFRKRKPAPVPKGKAARTATTVVNGCGDTFVATDYEQRINEAVFPGLQGGPHNNNIAAIAVGLHEAAQPAFADYQRQVLANSRRLAAKLQEYGYQIVTGGTDTHLLLVDFRPIKLDGVRVCSVLDLLGVTVNKNTVPGDISAMRPSGVRLGTPALTSRGLQLEDMDRVAGFIHRGIQLAQEISKRAASNNINDFEAVLASDEEVKDSMKTLRAEIIEFASSFPLPGMEDF